MAKSRESVDFSTEEAQKDFEKVPKEDQQHIIERSRDMADASNEARTALSNARSELKELQETGFGGSPRAQERRKFIEENSWRPENQEVDSGAQFDVDRIPDNQLSEKYEQIKIQDRRLADQLTKLVDLKFEAQKRAEKDKDYSRYDELNNECDRLQREFEHIVGMRQKIFERLQAKKS